MKKLALVLTTVLFFSMAAAIAAPNIHSQQNKKGFYFMAITENKFSAEELKTALTANKDELMPLVRQVLTSQDFKFTMRDETEETSFKTNFEAGIISAKTKEWAEKYEADVLEATGIPKETPDEKYHIYGKRAMTAIKTELNTLKGKNNPSETDKLRITQLEKAVSDKQTEFTNKTKELNEKIHTLQVDNVVEAAIAEYRATYKKDMPASVISLVEKNAKESLRKQAKLNDDGSIHFLNDKNEVISNPNDLKPETAKTVVKSFLSDLIDTGKQQAGGGSTGQTAGTGGQTGGTGAGAKQKVTALPAEVKTKTDLTDYLGKNGYLDSDPEFVEAFTTVGANLPLR